MPSAKPLARVFVNAAFAPGVVLEADAGQCHYLLHTLRAKAGDRVALFNGREGEWTAGLAMPSRKSVVFQLEAQVRAQAASPEVGLVFAPVKNEKIDYTVRRATELGVSALWPVMTRHTIVSRVNEERLRANAVEAAEQSGRLDVPEVHATQKLDTLLGAWPHERLLLHADESGAGLALREFLPTLQRQAMAVLIGPEGGFAEEERRLLAELPFVRGISLGPRILRAETAALAALANIMAWAGDWA